MAMGPSTTGPDVTAGRLSAEEYERNFADLHPLLGAHAAQVEADRCYFCHDAPCVRACPTSIDVPLFIRQIAVGDPGGSAGTILTRNILGGMCARVCPTETLCEEVCVREVAEGKPVRIGRLQRYATDHLMAAGGGHPFARAAPSGRKVAVAGAGPAGLSCAHRLARHGHAVTIFDAAAKPGGLNEYGIAAYKTADDFAAREVGFVLGVGGIELRSGAKLGETLSLDDLRADYDAVFLGVGLGGVGALEVEGDDLSGVENAVDYIADLRQAEDLAGLPVGARVVVIGGGMTAVDAAIQSRLLGAEEVTIVYRRGRDRMNASRYERDLAQTNGARLRCWAQPVRMIGENGALRAVEFERTREVDGVLRGTGETFAIEADMVFRAIGQVYAGGAQGLVLDGGRIRADAEGRTSVSGVWAGGDCVAGGQDLTVAAVEDGAVAAESIHRALIG